MKKVLVLEDESSIRSFIVINLRRAGYEVIEAGTGEEALEMLQQHSDIRVALLDVMLPGIDGYQVCREIRQRSNVPIIMITARGEDFEKIMGLEIGADDYIVKPFSPGEVMARIRAVMRRLGGGEKADRHFVYDNLSVNLEDYTVKIGGDSVPLTKKEIEILWTLAVDRNRVFTRENLLNSLGGCD